MAERLLVDQSRVARWESGENMPRGEWRKRLLKAIGKSEMEIFGHEELPRELPLHEKLAILEGLLRTQPERQSERGAAEITQKKLSPDKQRLMSLIPSLSDARIRILLDLADEPAVLSDENESAAPVSRKR